MTTASTDSKPSPLDKDRAALAGIVAAECARMRCTPSLIRSRHEIDVVSDELLKGLQRYRFSKKLNKKLSQVALRRGGKKPSALVDLRIVVRVWSEGSTVYVKIKRKRD